MKAARQLIHSMHSNIDELHEAIEHLKQEKAEIAAKLSDSLV